jgi:hypothetical protein
VAGAKDLAPDVATLDEETAGFGALDWIAGAAGD